MSKCEQFLAKVRGTGARVSRAGKHKVIVYLRHGGKKILDFKRNTEKTID